jgi:regulator of protease activity HflC (stomatin/prohibitin superfamily)
MDIDIAEVNSDLTVLDLRALKAEILAEVQQRHAEEARMQAKRDAERRLRSSASDRPDEVA